MIATIYCEDAIMIVVDRKAPWILELAWLVAWPAELRDERAFIIIVTREYLHSMVAGINDEQETLMVERQAGSAVECAISIALFLGADRELDSRVTIIINTTAFHVSQQDHSLTLTTTKRCVREMQEGGDVRDNEGANEKRTAPTHTAHDALAVNRANMACHLLVVHVTARQALILGDLMHSSSGPSRSKEREDLEQELVRNHRHRRLIDHRSNHRHRQDRFLHP